MHALPTIALIAGTLAGPSTLPAALPKLGKPLKIEANGTAISVDVGHAAPCVYDFDKDGKQDLIVGQFGEGKCRVYLNVGSREQPRFGSFDYLMAGSDHARANPG